MESLLAASLVLAISTSGLEDTSVDPAPSVEELVKSVLESRRTLSTGMFRAVGRKVTRSRGNPDATIDGGRVECFCAFDFTRGMLRYDNAEESLVNVKSNDDRDGKTKLRMREMQGARTPEYTVDWYGSDGSSVQAVEIRKPGAAFAHNWEHHVFDVRAIGLIHHGSFLRGLSFDALADAFAGEGGPTRAQRIDDNQIELVFEQTVATTSMTIDPARDYVCTRLVVNVEGMNEPMFVSTTEWTEINGQYVPSRAFLERDNQKAGSYWSYDFAFEWQNVNGPVDDRHFDYASFDRVPKGTDVFDNRGDVPVQVDGRRFDGQRPR